MEIPFGNHKRYSSVQSHRVVEFVLKNIGVVETVRITISKIKKDVIFLYRLQIINKFILGLL